MSHSQFRCIKLILRSGATFTVELPVDPGGRVPATDKP